MPSSSAAAELLGEGHARTTGRCRLLVAPMISGNRELIAGVVRDPQFGANVMLGVGGVLAEAVADVVFRPVPISEVDAYEMIDGLATQKLLGEFRGEAAVDRARLGRGADGPVGAGRRPSRHRQRRRQPADRPRRRHARRGRRTGGARRAGTSRSAAVRARPTDEQFRALFEPKGVLVTGASTHPGKFGFVSLHNILASGYPGGVYGTNLQGEEVLGVRTVADIDAAARRRDRPRLRLHPGRGQPRPAARLRRARA